MNTKRLEEILSHFPTIRILVLGDYFLDQYLMLNRDISEISLETQLECYQVTEIRNSPGAAGTVVNNLRALDIQVITLGAIGQDGRGFDLMQALKASQADTRYMVESDAMMTPTYTKPMLSGKNEPVHELERLDIKNRSHLPKNVEDSIMENLQKSFDAVDGIVVLDQVEEENCGVVTDRIRETICELGRQFPQKPILVDSRHRTGKFHHLIIKCNQSEALKNTDTKTVEEAAQKLFQVNPRGCFITLGSEGIYVYHNQTGKQVPGIRVEGPIDICGAGDSATSGILSSLCAGASYEEAALIGNITASITIRQLGTTGTASRDEIIAAAKKIALSD